MRPGGVAALVLVLLAGGARAAPPLPEPAAAIANARPSLGGLLRCLAGKITLVSGHRGGVEPGFPENAIETFANTLAQAPMLLEADVRTSEDGVLVLMHDASVDRTTTGSGPVNALTWAELASLRLKDKEGRETAFHVPRLDAALEWARGRGVLLLDVKEDAAVEAMARAIVDAKAQPFAGIIVYGPDQALRTSGIDPAIAVFFPVETASDLEALRARGMALDNIVAFAGIERQRPDLWRAIKALGAPVAFGTLFFTDHAIAMTGADAHYAYLATQGIDVLPTDRHLQAFRAIDGVADVTDALRACGALGG